MVRIIYAKFSKAIHEYVPHSMMSFQKVSPLVINQRPFHRFCWPNKETIFPSLRSRSQKVSSPNSSSEWLGLSVHAPQMLMHYRGGGGIRVNICVATIWTPALSSCTHQREAEGRRKKGDWIKKRPGLPESCCLPHVFCIA